MVRARAGGADLLVWSLPDAPGRSVERAVDWTRALAGRVPVLPASALRLPEPALVHPLPAGDPAVALAPGGAARVVGETLALLHGVAGPPSGGALPVLRRARRDHAAALARGADLGDRSRALLAAVEARSAGLDAPRGTVLVHGGLDPGQVWLAPDGGVTAVLGFDRARFGDPEEDLAAVLFVDAAADVLAGYRALRDGAPDADRLEAHAAAFVLSRLAADPDPDALQRLAEVADRVLAGGVAAQLADPAPLPPPTPGRALLRAGLRALAGRPEATWAPPIHAALALGLLAEAPAPAPGGLLAALARAAAGGHPSAARLAALGRRTLAAVPAAPTFPSPGPAPDPGPALAALDRDPPAGQAAAAHWLVAAARAALGGAVSDAVDGALRDHVDDLLAGAPAADPARAELLGVLHHLLAAPLRPASAAQVARHAALAGWSDLAALGADDPRASVADRAELRGAGLLWPVALAARERAPGLAATVPASVLEALLGG